MGAANSIHAIRMKDSLTVELRETLRTMCQVDEVELSAALSRARGLRLTERDFGPEPMVRSLPSALLAMPMARLGVRIC